MAALFAFLLLLGAWTASAQENTELAILHINDQHGVIDPLVGDWFDPGVPSLIGGIEQLESAIARRRADNPQNLLVSAGDFFQGAPESEAVGGDIIVDFMNLLAFDLAVIGNHDFDIGVNAITRLMLRSNFPVLGANVVNGHGRATPLPLRRTVMREFDHIRVGLSGLCTADTPELTLKENLPDIVFRNEETVAREVVDELRKAGADVIVLVNHLGINENLAIAEKVPDIDVIIGGHWHEGVSAVGRRSKNGRTLVAQAAPFCTALGIVKMTIDKTTKRVVASSATLEALRVGEAPMAPKSALLRERYAPLIALDLDEPLGEIRSELSGKRDSAAPPTSGLGRFFAEALRRSSGADAVLVAPESTGIGWRAGSITGRSIYHGAQLACDPVSIVEMTGTQLMAHIGQIIADPVLAPDLAGIAPAVSPERKVAISALTRIAGETISPTRRYRVAVSAFELERLRAFFTARKEPIPPIFRLGELREILRSYLRQKRDGVEAPRDLWSRLSGGDITASLTKVLAEAKTREIDDIVRSADSVPEFLTEAIKAAVPLASEKGAAEKLRQILTARSK